MTIRIAAIEVSHWHALHHAAYLRHLVAMPDVELVAVQDSDANLAARRAAEGYVARTSIAVSRPSGMATALGMGVGGLIFAGAALLGLQVVLSAVPWAYVGLKVGGGAYLIYLAVQLWRGARTPIGIGELPPEGSGGLHKFFLVGLATQLSNPKTAVAYASIFTALLPADPPSWIAWVILPMIFLIETGWYAVVAIVFSSEGPRRSYLGGKVWLDRLAAGIIGLLGAKLICEVK